jgi:predicted NBD/HSP70 family sugar kinase
MPPSPLASESETGPRGRTTGGHFVGVDVGGTKVAVATVDGEQFGEPSVRPTEAASTAGLIDEIVAVVEAARTRRTRAVGIPPGVGERTEIRLARHGQAAGVRGAALLAAIELDRGDFELIPPRAEVESAS